MILSNYILENRSDIDNVWGGVKVDVNKIWSDANVDGTIDLNDVKTIIDYMVTSEAERQNRGKALSEVTDEDLGSVIASDGKVYPAGTIGITPIAMIVYVGEPGTADRNRKDYRGLASALSDAGMENGSKYLNKRLSGEESPSILGYESVKDIIRAGVDGRDGLAVPVQYNVPVPPGNVTSGWFMPSAGQFIAFYQAYGLGFDEKTTLNWIFYKLPDEYDSNGNRISSGASKAIDLILTALRKAGDITTTVNNGSFWTCSPEVSYSRTGRVIFTEMMASSGFKFGNIASRDDEDSSTKKCIRPFLAF